MHGSPTTGHSTRQPSRKQGDSLHRMQLRDLDELLVERLGGRIQLGGSRRGHRAVRRCVASRKARRTMDVLASGLTFC